MNKLENYIEFINLLKNNVGNEISLKFKLDNSKLRDFSSFPSFTEFETLTGIIINSSQIHLIIKTDYKDNFNYYFIRFNDISEYKIKKLKH